MTPTTMAKAISAVISVSSTVPIVAIFLTPQG